MITDVWTLDILLRAPNHDQERDVEGPRSVFQLELLRVGNLESRE